MLISVDNNSFSDLVSVYLKTIDFKKFRNFEILNFHPCINFYRYIWEESDFICTGVYHKIPRFVHLLHLGVQHNHEGVLYLVFVCHNILNVYTLQSYVRLKP